MPIIAWAAFALVFSEETLSLSRSLLPAPELEGSFAVVSLNCAGGSERAAREVARHRPELVLYQERPGTPDLAEIARELKRAGAASVQVWTVARTPLD